MDDNPYLKILHARETQFYKALDATFAAPYILLAITILWLAAMSGPIFFLIIDSWFANIVNVPLAIFATLSLALGSLLSGVLSKMGKFLGTWKRPTVFLAGSAGPKFAGLCFYPPVAN